MRLADIEVSLGERQVQLDDLQHRCTRLSAECKEALTVASIQRQWLDTAVTQLSALQQVAATEAAQTPHLG